MTDKKTAPKMIYESQSSLYEKAVKMMKADRLIVQYKFKIENYLDAAELFDQMKGYRDADELAEKCRQLAEQTRKEEVEYRYQVALEQKEQATDSKEYEKAKALFGHIKGYKDVEQLIEECEKKRSYHEKREKGKRVGILLCVLLIATIVTGFFLSPAWDNLRAEIIAANIPETEMVSGEEKE